VKILKIISFLNKDSTPLTHYKLSFCCILENYKLFDTFAGSSSEFLDWPGVLDPEAQLSEHLHGRDLSIQSVEVEARHFSGVQQHAAHLHRLMDAVVTDSSVIVFDGFDDFGNLLWYLELRKLYKLT